MKLPDLHDLEISGVHAWHGDAQALANAAAAAKLRYMAADLKTVNSKPELLSALAKGFKLGDHFGNNWDILAEASDYWRERHKPFWVFVS
jgi:barstar (barnase inhibitor)